MWSFKLSKPENQKLNWTKEREDVETARDGGRLTVITLRPGVGGHWTVAGVVLPLLDADPHVGTGVFLACSARTYGGKAEQCNTGGKRPVMLLRCHAGVCNSTHAVWVSRDTQKTSRKLSNKRGIPYKQLDFSNKHHTLDIFNMACYRIDSDTGAKHELSHICTEEQRSMTTFNSEMCTQSRYYCYTC